MLFEAEGRALLLRDNGVRDVAVGLRVPQAEGKAGGDVRVHLRIVRGEHVEDPAGGVAACVDLSRVFGDLWG